MQLHTGGTPKTTLAFAIPPRSPACQLASEDRSENTR